MSKRNREIKTRAKNVEPVESDSDEEWDLTSDFIDLETCNPKLKKSYIETQKDVESSEPNIETILYSQILQEDKSELFQLFEIYANMHESLSLERFELRKNIITKMEEAHVKYKQYNRYSKEEHIRFNKEIKELEQYDETQELKYDILKLETSIDNKRIIYSEYKRMRNLYFSNDELPKLRNWLKWAIAIPHNKLKTFSYTKKELSTFIQKVSNKLDEELYGMQKVKEQILMFLNSRILNPEMKKCSLGLIGPPGTGKTRIAHIISEILEYPLEQISLGGIRSPEYLTGHQITYISSMPGEIVKRLAKMGVKNGIMFFDEYDKISNNEDVCTALLHITDPTQNHHFRDNFLSGITIDLSYLWFFYSMNNRPTDDALADRIFYVEISGYSQEDKIHIVKDYLLKKAHQNIGWKPNSVSFDLEAIKYLIEKVSPESEKGLRTLEHSISTIVNKINFLHSQQNKQGKMSIKTSFDINTLITFPLTITREKMERLL